MFRSYLRSALRALRRDRAVSIINIAGLSIALAACLSVYLFLQVYYTLDTHHAHADRIVMAEGVVMQDGAEQTVGRVPMPFGPMLAEMLPQVERVVRVAWLGGDVRTMKATFEERIGFAEPDFFEVFSFPLARGTADLADPTTAVLSEKTARAYFGDADPIGQRLTIAAGTQAGQAFTVTGVAAPFPDNASFRFSVLLPFAAHPDAASADDWRVPVDATFLLLHRPEDVGAVVAEAAAFVARASDARPDAPIERFAFETLADPAPGAHRVVARPTEAPEPAFAIVMVTLALLMLALSCFNYVNIALGGAARRIREIGVRKVLGGTRHHLVAQFMLENLLLCAAALVVGVGLAWGVLVPLFNDVFVIDIHLSLADARLWLFLGALLVGVGVASGAYPALYVAGFQPARILQGTARLKQKRGLTHTLTTAQFIVACVAVVLTALLAFNGRHLATQAWGYRPDGLLAVQLSDPAQFEPLRVAATGQAAVVRAAGAQDHIGTSMQRIRFGLGTDAPNAPPGHEAQALTVGSGYAEVMGLHLRSGRFFDPERSSDGAAVVINEELARSSGLGDPVGRVLRVEGQTYEIIGVAEDFLYDPLFRPQPLMFRCSDAAPRVLVVRTRAGREADVEAVLEKEWKRAFPDQPFEAFTQQRVFDDQIGSYANLARGIGYLSALALLIACLGLFGLASQNAARRMKEMSVRKVLGASVFHLVFVANRVFLVILAIAATVATGVAMAALVAVNRLDVVNLMPLTPVPFVVAYAAVGLAVGAAVAVQSRQIARANPTDALRAE